MRGAVQSPARRAGKSLYAVAAILSGPSGDTLRMRALRAANVERARRRLPPMRWGEMSASGRMHFLIAEAKAASGVILPPPTAKPVAKAKPVPAPCCSRCGGAEDLRRFLRRDIGERAFCATCAVHLADDLAELPPPPPPPVDADVPEPAKPCCDFCGDDEPLTSVFTNGVGWSQLCADCADAVCGDPPDDDDDPDAATGCADDHL